MNTLRLTNLMKTYENGVTSINNISLDIHNGMFGLLGPNGAGKSSLMRTIAGLQMPDTGSIIYNGTNIIEDPMAIKRALGYLPQEFGVYPKISALQLLDHLAVLKGLTDKKVRKLQIDNLLNQTNLWEHRNKSVHTFSGCMRQRFGIAQALLGSPGIIIVDEPTAGLDPEERHRFNNLLSEIGEQVIVILSTHIVEDVKDLCTDMAIIIKGAVVLKGNPTNLIDQLKGRIWAKVIDKKDLSWYKSNLDLISSRFNGGKLLIHVHALHQPQEGFEMINPDLEDVYFTSLFYNQLNAQTHAESPAAI